MRLSPESMMPSENGELTKFSYPRFSFGGTLESCGIAQEKAEAWEAWEAGTEESESVGR